MEQEGRYYRLSNGNTAHYEILKPLFSGIKDNEVTDQPHTDEIVANPLPLPEELITDDSESLD